MRRAALVLLLALANAGCMTITDTRSNVRSSQHFIPGGNRKATSELELVIDQAALTARLMRATECDGTLEVTSHFDDTHSRTPGPIVYVVAAASLLIFSNAILERDTEAGAAALALGAGVTGGALLLSGTTTKPRVEVRGLPVSGRPCGGWAQAGVEISVGLAQQAVGLVTDDQGQISLPPSLALDPARPPVVFAFGKAIPVRIQLGGDSAAKPGP